ncbi:MAG: DUF4980 domain-containing protein [Bacteroidales bacterium]|nr:DUF4980 domain-containing protein [Bacteroidales bacterium]
MNKRFFVAICFALSSVLNFAADKNVRPEPLAGGNIAIRIDANEQSKYLLLPIEEKADEARMQIIVNNDLRRNLYVRLARGHVDYYMPVLLDEFRGNEITIITHVGDYAKTACMSEFKLSDSFDKSNKEAFRPAFHHTPAYGWMNDPNGMFYLDGKWHLFFQYNPYGSMWGNMNWAHATSTDLINWNDEGIAIAPDALGSIFSGSCVVDKEGTAGFGKGAVVALYTSAGDVQCQSLAYSVDGGQTFTKYAGNPILTSDIPDFRDPNMFWNEDIKAWNLILACGQEMRIYSSPDLKNWKEESSFGSELGCHGGVWECPDLMKISTLDGKTSKWVLFCNINPGGPAGGSATQYFIGNFDGHTFTVDSESRYVNGNSLWQDYGKDHYATVSFSNAPDGRHTMIAWMSNWQYANDVPTMQYRSANSIAREPFLYYGADKQLYMGSRPSPEYDNKGLDKNVKIKGSCKIRLSNDEGQEMVFTYDQKAMTLTCDRSKSGIKDFSADFDVNAVAPVRNKLTSLRIFIDNSSIELFGNNGEVVMTSLVFPNSPLKNVKIEKL